MAARRGRRCSTAASGPARVTSCSTRATPTSSSRRRGSASAASGATSRADRSRVSGGPRTAAGAGRSRRRASRLTKTSAASGSRSRRRTRTSSTPLPKRRNARGGFFRSRDGGVSWERMSGYQAGGLYYNEIFADPVNVDRVYSVDVQVQVTEDGGRTFRRLGERNKHVDNHVVWIDPDDTEHLLIGCDGGLYESFDRGQNYRFFANLPDHAVLSRRHGQRAAVLSGLRRHAGQLLVRRAVAHAHGARHHERRLVRDCRRRRLRQSRAIRKTRTPCMPSRSTAICSGSIWRRASRSTSCRKPSRARMRCAGTGTRRSSSARTQTRGSTSPRTASIAATIAATRGARSVRDLSRKIDRNKLKLMDRVWSVDAVAKNTSTSFYGSVVTLAESPREGGLAGRGDGRRTDSDQRERRTRAGGRSIASPACPIRPSSRA